MSKVEVYTAWRLEQARRTVLHLSTLKSSTLESSGVAFSRLLFDLLESDDSRGVSENIVDKYLVAPDEAARIFKRYQAILYHFPTGTYRFHSVAHRRAAEELRDAGLLETNL